MPNNNFQIIKRDKGKYEKEEGKDCEMVIQAFSRLYVIHSSTIVQ